MKKILLIATTLVATLFQANAQCTIVPCTPSPTLGFCANPSSTAGLPNGYLNVPYSTDIQFTLGNSVTFNGIPIPITSASITATSGLPPGLTETKNPTTGSVTAGASACLHISGTPTAIGNYTFMATFNVVTVATTTVITAPWNINILPTAAGIATLNNPNTAAMVVSPNPAKSEITVNANFYIAKLSLIDALGKVVMAQDMNYTNQTTLDIHNLERGIYFLQISDGSLLVTKKFIKD